MEGGIAGLAVASGMAAITYAVQCICEVGDNIVSTSQVYGGTYNLFAHTLPRQGIETRFASHDDYAALEAHIDSRTRAIFVSLLVTQRVMLLILQNWLKLPNVMVFP